MKENEIYWDLAEKYLEKVKKHKMPDRVELEKYLSREELEKLAKVYGVEVEMPGEGYK